MDGPGRAVPEADSDDIRELIFRKNYRIIYVLRDDCVQILAIIHAGRGLESAPSKPWDPDLVLPSRLSSR